jgi:ribosomal-protein-serine acetyltransferase
MPDRTGRLPELLEGDGIVLRRWQSDYLEALGRALAESVDHLRPWMAWVSQKPLSEAERREMFERVDREWRDGGDVRLGVFLEERVIGSAGMHRRIGPGGLEFGYWIHPELTRRGYATAAARLMTDAALSLPDIDRVEIHHDKANIASAGVPRRLGFELVEERFDGVQAPAESGIECVWRMDRHRWRRSVSVRP